MHDIAQDRDERIEEVVAARGQDWADRFQPGTFGCHELLDRTLLATNLLETSPCSLIRRACSTKNGYTCGASRISTEPE